MEGTARTEQEDVTDFLRLFLHPSQTCSGRSNAEYMHQIRSKLPILSLVKCSVVHPARKEMFPCHGFETRSVQIQSVKVHHKKTFSLLEPR
jgi:hypothetical protein